MYSWSIDEVVCSGDVLVLSADVGLFIWRGEGFGTNTAYTTRVDTDLCRIVSIKNLLD